MKPTEDLQAAPAKPVHDWFMSLYADAKPVETRQVGTVTVHLYRDEEGDCDYRLEFPDDRDDELSNWFKSIESAFEGAKSRIQELKNTGQEND